MTVALTKSKHGVHLSAALAERTFWKAIVRTGGTFAASRERDSIEWHLVDCPAPRAQGRHCNAGQHLLEIGGQPDGHCVVDGRCGRCGETTRAQTGAARGPIRSSKLSAERNQKEQ